MSNKETNIGNFTENVDRRYSEIMSEVEGMLWVSRPHHINPIVKEAVSNLYKINSAVIMYKKSSKIFDGHAAYKHHAEYLRNENKSRMEGDFRYAEAYNRLSVLFFSMCALSDRKDENSHRSYNDYSLPAIANSNEVLNLINNRVGNGRI